MRNYRNYLRTFWKLFLGGKEISSRILIVKENARDSEGNIHHFQEKVHLMRKTRIDLQQKVEMKACIQSGIKSGWRRVVVHNKKGLLLITLLAATNLFPTQAGNMVIPSSYFSKPLEGEFLRGTPLKSRSSTVREVTAYNVGDPTQTDESPCIGAGGDDLCLHLEKENICAANFVPLGTRLLIEKFGECLVMDRMHGRYRNRVDIAMGVGERKRALLFGKQRLRVKSLSQK